MLQERLTDALSAEDRDFFRSYSRYYRARSLRLETATQPVLQERRLGEAGARAESFEHASC